MIALRYRTLVAFFAGVALTVVAVFVLQAFRADAFPGENDTTFVPVAPCRLIDTRPNSPGSPPINVGPRSTPISENFPVTFNVWGTDSNSTCDIPTSATAISTNTTIVDPTAASYLTLYPADVASPPVASNLNYSAGQEPTPNAVTTRLSPHGEFSVLNRYGSVHVVIDVNGYFTKTSLQALQAEVTRFGKLTASMSNVSVDGKPTVRFSSVNLDTHGRKRCHLLEGQRDGQPDHRLQRKLLRCSDREPQPGPRLRQRLLQLRRFRLRSQQHHQRPQCIGVRRNSTRPAGRGPWCPAAVET